MATLVAELSQIVEEDLTRGVPSSLPALDSLWNGLFTTAMGVTSDGIGRDFQVIHTFRTGVSGAIKWVAIAGPASDTGFTQVNTTDANDTFPGLDEHAGPGHVQKKVTLAKAMGNVLIPDDWERLGKLTAAIADGAAEVIRGAAENAAMAEINAWYSQESTGYLAKIASETTASNVATEDRMTIIITAGSVRNFYPGMVIDVYNPTGPAKRTYSDNLVVDGVRYVPDTTNDTSGYGEIILQSRGGAGGSDLSTATSGIDAGDLLVRKDSVSLGPLGPETWLVSTGTVFNINVATHQQFQSVLDAPGGVLTETRLNRIWGRFFQAYGMQNMPDTVITSMGVTNAHVENSDGLGRFDRTNKPFVVADGFNMGAIPFQFNGMNMAWHVTAFMPSDSDVTAASPVGGRLWGLKLRDQNIKRYVPPMIDDSRTGVAPFPSEIEFARPLGGRMGIFKPYHSRVSGTAGATTVYKEAPFYRHVAFLPRFLPGIKMTSLLENL